MHEYLFSLAEANTWPGSAESERVLADAEAFDCTAAIADVIAVTGDTRRLSHISAGLLAAVLVAAATMGAALLVRGHPLALGSLGLLVPVLVGWLVAATLVLYSEGPVTSAFAVLRRATGAPVNPYAPWVPAGMEPLADSELTWDYVVPLIAARDASTNGRASPCPRRSSRPRHSCSGWCSRSWWPR